MRENRTYGSEGGESGSTGLPYPYRVLWYFIHVAAFLRNVDSSCLRETRLRVLGFHVGAFGKQPLRKIVKERVEDRDGQEGEDK